MADVAWDINYKQTELVAQKCKEIGIDGIIAGYSEERASSLGSIVRDSALIRDLEIPGEKRRFRGLPERAANKHYQNIADKQKERARHENTIQNPGKRRGGDP